MGYDLETYERKYWQLRELWESFSTFVEHQAPYKGRSYSAVRRTESSDELQWEIFGIPCYARFRHTFEQGSIEYGVFCGASMPLHRPVATLTFDKLGNLDKKWDLRSEADVSSAHRQILRDKAEELVQIYSTCERN